MKKLALLGLSVAALCVGGFSQLQNVNKVAEARDATIIVKLKGDVSKNSQKAILAKQNAVLSDISNNITHNYRVKNRYSHALNGIVLEVPSAYVSSIRYLDGVDKVNYNNMMFETSSIDDGVNYEITLGSGSGTASSQTMEKPSGTNEGSGTFVAILDNGFYIKTNEDGTQEYHEVFRPLENDADIVVTQASLKAKIDAAEKFNGMYDDDHTTYYNTKVPFYFDYGGDRMSPSQDFDVYAEGQDHGTHVASIAGGNSNQYQGIAPKAQLALMKVFVTYISGLEYKSGAYPSSILSALEDCLVLGVDTINMSLGSNLNDFDDGEIIEDVIRQLNNKGTFVNVAAGNSGKDQWSKTSYKYWQRDTVESNIISSYANNMAAMTIASAQPDFQFYGEAITVDGNNIQYSDQVTNYTSSDGQVTFDPELRLMDLYDDSEGATNEIEFFYTGDTGVGALKEYEGVDMHGKIAIVNRGSINFGTKVENAYSLGAVAIGIIDNTSNTEFNLRMLFSTDTVSNYKPLIPVIFILNKDKETFSKAQNNVLKLLKNQDLGNPTKRQISDYSSDGMRYDLSIKPEVSTPGENIKGAVLGATDKYESMSGTSMATPNYTGAVALMISNHLNDAEYRKTINARLMSTAQPMKDNSADHIYTSVRRQGAGLVNLDAAINSKVYLDGVDTNGNSIGKAKIELFNNEKIKAGKLDLSFKAINEGENAVSYTAKTYVLAPKLEEYSADIYPELAGEKMQSTNEQLVQVFTDTVNIPVGATTINLPEHTIDSDKLAALDADFEYGCILEGFVILEATNSLKQLSIPFLGYYGNLDEVSPVEPFDFEREEGKIYNSDILNYFITQSIGKSDTYDYTKADYTSRIVAGYWPDQSKVSVSDALLRNTSGITRITDSNGDAVKRVGLNPHTGLLDRNALFVGNNGSTNTMIIQQYVTRSVWTNDLTLTSKATNEVVLRDHMFDNRMGSQTNSETGEETYPLYKSIFDDSMFDSGYLAHRAYTIIPLYSADENKVQTNYPDGEYEMKFSYQLSSGSVYEMSYTLTIESTVPTLNNIEKISKDGQEYYRFQYNDDNLSVVNINGNKYDVVKEGNVLYADVPVSAFADGNVALVTSLDTAYGQEKCLTHVDGKYFITASHRIFIAGYDFSYDVQGEDTNSQVITFEITKNNKTVSISGAVSYRMRVPDGLDIDTLKVYTVDSRGREKEISFNKNGNIIEFSNTIRKFHLASDPVFMGLTVTSSVNEYTTGDTFDASVLTVNANYSDGSVVALNASDYTVSAVDLSTAGEKNVVISYQGFEASLTINVKDPAPLPPDNPPSGGDSSDPGQASIPGQTSNPGETSNPVTPSEPAANNEPAASEEKKSGCAGSIAGISMMSLVVSAFGIILVSLKKKKLR